MYLFPFLLVLLCVRQHAHEPHVCRCGAIQPHTSTFLLLVHVRACFLQSGRDVETTKPATVRFLGHPSFPAGSATTAGNGDAASRDGVDEATVASTATATAVTGAAASASTDMEPSLKPLPSNKAMSQTQGAVWLEFTLEEGRNRQIRRLCARSGLGVRRQRVLALQVHLRFL